MKTLHISLPTLFLFFIILGTIMFRARLINVPLERDEGEYAYIGQLILEGIPLYTEAYNMKFPGIYFIYAGILCLFGQTHTAIHFSLLLVNVLSIILLYLFTRRTFDNWTATAASAAFALLSMSYHVQGFWANAEHFILPFVIGANIFLLSGVRRNKLRFIFLSAILFGCTALVKQHGAFFGVVGFAVMLLSMWRNKVQDRSKYWSYSVTFFGGILLPLLLCFCYLVSAGVLEKFYLWTFMYAKEYSSLSTLSGIKFNFIGGFQSLFKFASLIWIVSGVGFLSLFFHRYSRESRIFTVGLLFAGIIALSVGFYFRPHYFVLILPAAALLFGIGIRSIYKLFAPAPSLLLRYFPPTFTVVVALLGTLVAHWDVLVQFSIPKVTETVYHMNPFPFSEKIAELIRKKTTKNDRIAIIGNEPQILFYSQRRSATSFIYTYSLGEDQPLAEQFRTEMIRQIETSSPQLIVYTNIQPEWYKKPKNWEELDTWFKCYTQSQYTLTARFEYLNIRDTLLVTDPVLLAKHPTHLFWISLYERRTNG